MGTYIAPDMQFKECGTPDAVYGAVVEHKWMRFDVSLPIPLIRADHQATRDAFIAEMHQAMLPVIERLYEREWARFAGTTDKDGRLYPATYAELWPEPKAKP